MFGLAESAADRFDASPSLLMLGKPHCCLFRKQQARVAFLWFNMTLALHNLLADQDKKIRSDPSIESVP